MFKLVFFLIGLAVAIIFSALNISNVSDISFGFKTLTDIPVFLSLMLAFFAGAVFTLPFAFYASIGKRKEKKKTESAPFVPDQAPDEFKPEDME